MWIPFAKGSEIPLAGRNFYGGARGNLPYVRSPRFQRGEYGPAERKALSSALVGLKPSLNLVPPRPLQATPTPSSGFGVTFAPLLAIGICRAGHGRIKDKALTEAQSSLD